MAHLDERLLRAMADPEDHGELIYVESEDVLYNPRNKRKYLVKEGIPVLLVDEAVVASDAEHARYIEGRSS